MTEKKPLSKAERVDIIEDKMRKLEWRRGITTRLLEKEWGVKRKVIEDDAAEASRRLQFSKEEMEARKAEHAALLEAVMWRMLEWRGKLTGLPDFKSFNEAWQMFAEYALKWKPESDHKPEGPSPAKLSDEDLKALIEKAVNTLSSSKS